MVLHLSKPFLLACAVAVITGGCSEPIRPHIGGPSSRVLAPTSQDYCTPSLSGCTTTVTWTPANYFCGEDCPAGPAQMNPITGTFSKPVYHLWLNLGGALGCYGTYGTVTLFNRQGRQVEQRDLVLGDTTGCGNTGWQCCSTTFDSLQFPGGIASITITAPQPATFHVNGGDPDTLHGYVHVQPTPWYYETRPPTVDSCLTGDEWLDQQAMRDLLLDEWNNYAHIDSIASKRREVRGWLFEDSTGNLVHALYPYTVAVFPDTIVDTPCLSDGAPTQLPGIPLAGAHPHPFAAGDTLPGMACFKTSTPIYAYDIKKYGGPSKADILSAGYDQLPHYILDKINMYLLPLGIDTLNARSRVKKYPRVDPVSGCRRL